MLATTLSLIAAALPLSPPARHSIAIVNDPRSHGILGDDKLSLNEVILLNQRQLHIAQLSVAEQGQILGAGPDVAWADIDIAAAPVITFERDLDLINDQPHGLVVASSSGRPTLLIGNTAGIVANCNYVNFLGLDFRGGATAITLTQTDALYGTIIAGCTFAGQTDTAVRVTLSGPGATHIEVENSEFKNLPKAIEVFDTGVGRRGSLVIEKSKILGGQLGLVVHLGPGGTLFVNLERIDIAGTATAIAFDRPTATDTRRVTLSGLFARVAAGATAFSFQGHPQVADTLTLRMIDFATPGTALRLWPSGTQLQAVVDDSRLTGSAELLTGSTGTGIEIGNVRMRAGTLTMGSTGARLHVTDTVLNQVNTISQGNTAVQIDGSCFIGGSLSGQATAPVDVLTSYLGGAAVGPHVQVTTALPLPQLGSMEMAPFEAQLGSSLTLRSDLPPGLAGLWLFGVAETLPFIGPRPFHFYIFTSAHVALPVVARLQSTVQIPVPVAPPLLGWSFVAQLAVLPDPGVTAPPLSLPPGRRTTIQ